MSTSTHNIQQVPCQWFPIQQMPLCMLFFFRSSLNSAVWCKHEGHEQLHTTVQLYASPAPYHAHHQVAGVPLASVKETVVVNKRMATISGPAEEIG